MKGGVPSSLCLPPAPVARMGAWLSPRGGANGCGWRLSLSLLGVAAAAVCSQVLLMMMMTCLVVVQPCSAAPVDSVMVGIDAAVLGHMTNCSCTPMLQFLNELAGQSGGPKKEDTADRSLQLRVHTVVSYDFNASQLEFLFRCGLFPAMDVHASYGIRSRQAKAHGVKVPQLKPVLDRTIAAAKAAGLPESDVVWKAFEEADSSGVGFPHELMQAAPRTAQEAQSVWDAHLGESWSNVEEVLGGTPRSGGVQVWGRFGFSAFPHSLGELGGVSRILIERANDDVGDLLPAIAFARGAARQFATSVHGGWGIDLSLWWGVISGGVSLLPSLFHKRHMYASLVAGSSVVAIEQGPLFHSNGTLSQLGVDFAAFSRFARERKKKAAGGFLGEPDVPFGIVMPRDHGWLPPPAWATSTDQTSQWTYARQQRRSGLRSADGLFGHIFPGVGLSAYPWPFGRYERETDPPPSPCALDYVDAQWAPHASDRFAADTPLHFGEFKDRKTAAKYMAASGLEPSHFRPMANTRFGSVFDVLTNSAKPHVLQGYRVLIVLGPINASDALFPRLREYAAGGGTVVVAAGTVTPVHATLTGLNMGDRMLVAHGWRWNGDINDDTLGAAAGQGQPKTVFEPITYVPATQIPGSGSRVLASVVGSGESAPSPPLLVEHREPSWLSGGRVITSLVPWFTGFPESGAQLLSGPVTRLLDELLSPLLPSTVRGELPMQWHTSSTTASGRRRIQGAGDAKEAASSQSVLLVNNNAADLQNTEVGLNGFARPPQRCTVGLLSPKPVEFAYDKSRRVVTVTVKTVPAFDVVLVQCADE